MLADENRLKLLGILAADEHSVEELAALLQLRAPTISHHLAKLKELISTKEQLMQREHGFYWRIPAGENWRSVILRSTDRQPLQIWLGTPNGSGPFPTILELHEGPDCTQADWLSPLAQTWVEAGFAYLVINYPAPAPGSYGLSFQERVAGDPGHWEQEDLLTARSWLLAQNIADPERILLTGWSYSAFAVLLAVSRTSERWAGAIAGAPVLNWVREIEQMVEQQKNMLDFARRVLSLS